MQSPIGAPPHASPMVPAGPHRLGRTNPKILQSCWKDRHSERFCKHGREKRHTLAILPLPHIHTCRHVHA